MRGRRYGTRVTYTSAQTRRYQSYFLRKQRALKLPAPWRKGTAYYFWPRDRRRPPYRVTPRLESSPQESLWRSEWLGPTR